MKKITKIAFALAASVFMGAAFVGCAKEEGTTGSLDEDFSLTNETTDGYMRGYKTAKTKHTSAVAKITLPKPSGKQENGDGVVGMVFHVVENADGSQNFGIIGTRRKVDGTLQYYISMFKNANVEKYLNLKGNFCDNDGIMIGEAGSKAEEIGVPDTDFHTLKKVTGDGDYVLYVILEAGGDDEEGLIKAGEGNGSYKVKFADEAGYAKYKEMMNAKDEDTATMAWLAFQSAVLKSATIPSSVTGDKVATQYYLGMYTNAYPGCTLKGKLEMTDYVNECEIILED